MFGAEMHEQMTKTLMLLEKLSVSECVCMCVCVCPLDVTTEVRRLFIILSSQLFCMQGEDDVPPRPPLPQLYSPDEHPPAVPPLPRESTVIRHTSVRGLKRQSDERKRDREIGHYGNGDSKVRPPHGILGIQAAARAQSHNSWCSVCASQMELRPFLSDPELMGAGDGSSNVSLVSSGRDGYQTLPSRGTERVKIYTTRVTEPCIDSWRVWFGCSPASSVVIFVGFPQELSAPQWG